MSVGNCDEHFINTINHLIKRRVRRLLNKVVDTLQLNQSSIKWLSEELQLQRKKKNKTLKMSLGTLGKLGQTLQVFHRRDQDESASSVVKEQNSLIQLIR